MVVNHKPTGRASSIPGGLFFGAMTCIAVTVLGSAILAKLISSEIIAEKNIGYGVMLILLVGSFIGAQSSYRKIKRQRLKVCLLSGIVYYGLLLSITALFFGGQYDAAGVTGVLILGGSLTAGLTGLNSKREGKLKNLKIPNR